MEKKTCQLLCSSLPYRNMLSKNHPLNPSNRLLHEMTTIPFQKKKTHTEFNDERATFEETVSVSPRLNGFLAHHTNILPPPGEIQVTQTISTNLNASNLKAQHEQRQRGKNPAMTSVIESWLDNRASFLMAYERP